MLVVVGVFVYCVCGCCWAFDVGVLVGFGFGLIKIGVLITLVRCSLLCAVTAVCCWFVVFC